MSTAGAPAGGRSSRLLLPGVVFAGLAMSVGWGIRGDYGHEAGAMIPGALFGLAVCCASGRADWWRRAGVMGLCGALGWALGGQMSYGRVVGYTAASSLPDVAYGYASLFVVGGLWGGVGAGVLGLGVTEARSFLERCVRPLIVLGVVWVLLDSTGATRRLVDRWALHDTDWVAALSALVVASAWAVAVPRDRPGAAAIATLAAGWGGGYLLLTGIGGLHMTPPRSDNWAGSTGLFVALLLLLAARRNRASLMLAGWGFLFGGLGFVLGDFAQILGRAQWGPIGRHAALQGLDYWKWMEQLFGLVMGLGIAGVFLRRVPRLAPPPEDLPGGWLDTLALAVLLVAAPWANLPRNARTWARADLLPDQVLGLDPALWLALVGGVLTAGVVVAILEDRRGVLSLAPAGPRSRGQLLFLLLLSVFLVGALLQAVPRLGERGVFFVHATFWLTGGGCLLLLLRLGDERPAGTDGLSSPADPHWRPGVRYWAALAFVPLLVVLVAWLTLASHEEPLPGSHRRFSPASVGSPVPRVEGRQTSWRRKASRVHSAIRARIV